MGLARPQSKAQQAATRQSVAGSCLTFDGPAPQSGGRLGSTWAAYSRATSARRHTGTMADPGVTREQPYHEWPGFDGYYLEDSWVLGLHITGAEVVVDLDVVLTERHPGYSPPRPGEQYCYRRGRLVFSGIRGIEVQEPLLMRPATDAAGERDLGNIDSLRRSGPLFLMEGEWGVIAIESDPPRVELQTN